MGVPVGLRIVLFEDCSAFTRVTACTLAKSPNVTLYTGGSSHFVTSMTAPIASGWSESCRVGFSPTGKTPPFTAHTRSGHYTAQATPAFCVGRTAASQSIAKPFCVAKVTIIKAFNHIL
jgi:hypothetical protein